MASFARRMLRGRTAPDPAPTPTTPADMLERTLTDDERRILAACAPFTMTSPQRLLALIDAVHHVVRRGLPGAFAECGVWRGGSVLAMALSLQTLGAPHRDIHLYDTFEGMTAPTDADTSPFHEPALEAWTASGGRPYAEMFNPEMFDEASVRSMLLATGYPAERLHFHAGDVLETIPAGAPEAVALLRLDTDWYESTKHELEHLYPRLATGGVLIIDDYGHWEGARKAVDEYFGDRMPLLHRIDYTGRIAVKE